MIPWYQDNAPRVLARLGTDWNGLSSAAALARAKTDGPNQLPEPKEIGWWQLFFKQFSSPLIYLLFLAAALMWWLNDPVDALVIAAVLLVNAVIGVIQEGRAEQALRALKRLGGGQATVWRDGIEQVISDAGLVVGDVIILREGDRVPADARLLSADHLEVDEAVLTGESESVAKDSKALEGDRLALGDQRNMLFSGTFVSSGGGQAVVVAIGQKTEIGQISQKLATVDSDVPLKRAIAKLSYVIIVVVLSLGALIFAVGVAVGLSPATIFGVVVALVVSAIPEGLPVVVTLILATGVARMARRKVLVKRLQAVEALGQAELIAVDKTGTLTKNQMMVSVIYTGDQWFTVGGSGYDPTGELKSGNQAVASTDDPELNLLGRVASFASRALVAQKAETGTWERTAGDPTEAALLVLGQKLGFNRESLLGRSPQLSEILFDSAHKYHAAVNLVEGKPFLSIAGAPEVILAECQHYWRGGQIHDLGERERAALQEAQELMMGQGLRVIALAQSDHASRVVSTGHLPRLNLVGLVGIHDALRPEVPAAVAAANAAGVRLVMITGDHRVTAVALAREAGIYHDGDWVITGSELETMSTAELAARLDRTTVFARVSPDHKLKIIEGYKARGQVVAMTGDGVNDALSLAAADLGVAMGGIGTEVAKAAADIVLVDDNFGNIVQAIEEGRSIYRTIQKVLLYLFSTSLGEILTIAVAIMAGWPLPVLASQIIWLNFVTDGFLVAALAFEPKERHLLSRGREFRQTNLLNRATLGRLFLLAAVMAAGTLVLFENFLTIDPLKATTVALTTLAVYQWLNAWNVRSATHSFFNRRMFENAYLVAALAAVIVLQLLAVYWSGLQRVLKTTSLSLGDWLLILGVAFSVVLVEELRKLIARSLRSLKIG